MHELSIARAVLNTAIAHAGERPVQVVAMRIGALRQVVPASLQFYWEIVARETQCERSLLALTEVPARLRCEECQFEWEPAAPAFRCPRCDTGEVAIIAGEELEVEFIEVDEQEAACTGPR